ncbi:MAG: hypothetical protein E4H18_03755, partial [Hyphomicrobiales bacterium]
MSWTLATFCARGPALALLVAGCLIWPLAAAADIEADVAAAFAAADAGDVRGAHNMLTAIIQSGELPGERQAVMYFNRGVARQLMGDLGGAVDDFTEAIALAPAYAD